VDFVKIEGVTMKRFSKQRLDLELRGYTPEEVEDLVERGKIPKEEGQNWFNGYFGGEGYA